jgi:hypothetical protein
LDPFCGCDPTVDSAEKHGLDWIGTGIIQLAITLIKERLLDTCCSRLKFVRSRAPMGRDVFPRVPTESLVHILSEPTAPADAVALAEEDKSLLPWAVNHEQLETPI